MDSVLCKNSDYSELLSHVSSLHLIPQLKASCVFSARFPWPPTPLVSAPVLGPYELVRTSTPLGVQGGILWQTSSFIVLFFLYFLLLSWARN